LVDIRRFFESRLRKYGDSPRSLDWSEQGQLRRFEVLSEIGNLRGRHVLDVGCGLGHLYDFLRDRVGEIHYTGLDMSPRMIHEARRRHPDLSFQVHDAATTLLPHGADFVLASGLMNLEIGQNEAAMERLLRNCYSACREGVGVTMLSRWADRFDRNRHYYDPVQILRMARRLTRWVVLRHDYMPHDFALYLYKR